MNKSFVQSISSFPAWVLLGGLAAAPALAGTAAQADARLTQLEEELQALQQRLAVQEQQLQARAGATVATTTNGRNLSFRTADGDYAFQVGGRLQVDAAVHDAGSGTDFSDGTAIRRLFLDVRGTFSEHWRYRYQYDFVRPGGSDRGARGVRDAWLQYTGFGPHLVTVGNFKAPLGLEHLSSGLGTTFIERGLTDLFSPDRRLGVGVSSSGANWSGAWGVFGERAEGVVGTEGDEGWDLNGRFSLAPLNSGGQVLHFGVASRLHKPRDSTNELRFSSRPETNVTGVRVIDTGVVAGVDDFYSFGLEAGLVLGAFSAQGEYIATKLNRSSGLSDADLSAWYIYASYTLTGEPRRYQSQTGTFDRPRVANPVGKGGKGSWEVAARFSSADLNDADIQGGRFDNLTLGLNWYAVDNLRFSANYTQALKLDRAGSPYDDLSLKALTARAQVDF